MWLRRRRVVLVGDLDRATVRELIVHCRGLAEQGWPRVTIDASGVTGCDRSGLSGLCELAQGRAGVEVELSGVCWSQFFPALQATPLAELTATHHQLRELLDTATPGHAGPPDHPEPPADEPPASASPAAVPHQRGRHRRIPSQIGTPTA